MEAWRRWQSELEKHTITYIGAKLARNRYPRLYGKNARLPEHSYGDDFLVLEVRTDLHASGWGMNRRIYSNGTLTKRREAPDLKELVGLRLNELFDPAVGVTDPRALPLDFALHDLAGSILNEPVYRLIGGTGPLANPCYDGAIYMDDISPGEIDRGVGVILENCRKDYESGYRAFKVKIGRGNKWMNAEEGLRRDIEVTRAIRKAYPEATLMVDANDGYSVDGFLRYVDAVADCELYWIEEPFREHREGLLRLKEKLAKVSPQTRIADGEAQPKLEELLPLAKEGLIDVLLMDIEYYGFTEWRALQPELIRAGISSSPHNWGERIKTHYTAQLAAGLGNVLTIEGVPDETEGVDYSGYEMRDGVLSIPDKPGFGMTLEWAREWKREEIRG